MPTICLPRGLATVLFCTALLAASLSRACKAQPFGIAEGTPISKLNVIRELNTFSYEIKPAITHIDFKDYDVIATPESGVCSISALTKFIDDDSQGIKIRQKFEYIKEQIEGKYGNSHLYDLIDNNSSWKLAKDWMQSIEAKDRTYKSYWSKKYGSKLSSKVSIISLTVISVSSSASFIKLIFQFENIDKCLHERQVEDATPF